MVARGARFDIDFAKRIAMVDKNVCVFNGEVNEAFDPIEGKIDQETALSNLNKLYKEYKYSVPTENSESRRRKYFKAVKASELTDMELCCNDVRDLAQLRLEMTLLIYIINGTLTWGEGELNPQYYFWQSKEDKDFVILREWITSTNK